MMDFLLFHKSFVSVSLKPRKARNLYGPAGNLYGGRLRRLMEKPNRESKKKGPRVNRTNWGGRSYVL